MTSMKVSMDSHDKKTNVYIGTGIIILLILAFTGLCVGRYPLSFSTMLSGDTYQLKIFYNLRFSRVIVGVLGGFTLGIAGYIFQIIFHNPLAAPDIIGVSSGASAGAAFGILFFGSAYAVTVSSFTGALISVVLAIILATTDKSNSKNTIVLSGVAIHSLAQTVLMCLKIIADPERELASIEYWIMGSLNAVNMSSAKINLIIAILCIFVSILFHRQIILLSSNEDEARLLGINVSQMRLMILIVATLMVSSIISMTGLISFIGLIAPHCARLLTRRNNIRTMMLGGIIGGCILCLADILARSITYSELPVSIFTSLIGAPFLVMLVVRRKNL